MHVWKTIEYCTMNNWTWNKYTICKNLSTAVVYPTGQMYQYCVRNLLLPGMHLGIGRGSIHQVLTPPPPPPPLFPPSPCGRYRPGGPLIQAKPNCLECGLETQNCHIPGPGGSCNDNRLERWQLLFIHFIDYTIGNKVWGKYVLDAYRMLDIALF
jgi:hypothetical protein